MQIFHRSTNTIARVSILFGAAIVASLFPLGYAYVKSDHYTGVGVAKVQPIQFPHQHHVAGLGIQCRYCHTSVANASYANVPPTQTCMNCHNQIWSDSPYLELVRKSWREDRSIEWNKVHYLPGHVYFNHSIHVAKGVQCSACHGAVEQMNLVYKANTLQMEWCLNCHRHPERYIGPATGVKPSVWEVPHDAPADYRDQHGHPGLNHINGLTTCSTCHR
jgi:hypothetical protein